VSFEPILLAPEEIAEEIYPYRRVWQTSWLEILVLLFGVVLILLLTDILHILPDDLSDPLPRLGIALLPLGAWLVFSYRGERRALQPRPALLGIVVLGALVANGIAVPLEERLFVPDQWLPQSGFFGRVIGYMLTVGFTAEFLKYAVLRYSVWPHRFNQRLDGIAYALAVSLGYATVYNLRFALYTEATLPATALRVASFTFSHLAIGLIIGFALAELRIGRPPVFWLPVNLLLAAFLSGLYYAFRNLAIVGGLNVGSTASAPIRGFALAVGLVMIMFFTVAFLVESADARMEALTGRRHAL
jgi:RsiW-degrading membrane proteinase PrsW (M82 family)